jgi:quercetin dioxygenase-like cupin family protein
MAVQGAKVPAPHERVVKVMLAPEIGNTDKCTMLLVMIIPGGDTSVHTHDSDEMIYVAAGRGSVQVGQENMEFREGTVIRAPKGVEHILANTGNETVKLVCFFVPPIKPAGYLEEALSKAREYFKTRS